MKLDDAKELFRSLTVAFFPDYEVVLARQSRSAKPEIPLVQITFGNVKRSVHAVENVDEGIVEGQFQARVAVTVDLFTKGKAVTENGLTVYENSAVGELLSYCDYLNSVETIDWAARNNLAVLTEGDAQDVTGIVNDNNYEYRARQELFLYYTHDAGTDYSNKWYFTEAEASEEE